MGRVKLKIKRLDNTNGRQATYAKRKNGIMKKANELSILCDIDIILLMFSPTGKPSLCTGKRSSIEEVIAKFAQLTPQERAKRKLESLEALKKAFKKLDHDVNIQDFLGISSHTVEDLTNQTELLQCKISEAQRRLSLWKKPEKIDNVEHLGQMEDSLRKSLNQIRAQKENLEKQQLMSISLESSSQFQNGMQVPFGIGVEQQFQTLPWIPNNDNQHVVLNEDPNLLQQRNIECAASSSLEAYASYLGIGNGSQMSNLKPENGILNDLIRSASMGQQYPSYHNISMPSNMKIQLGEEMNPTSNPLNSGQCQPAFGAQQPGFDMAQSSWGFSTGPCTDPQGNWAANLLPRGGDAANGTWASSSGPYGIGVPMFDERLYHQQPN